MKTLPRYLLMPLIGAGAATSVHAQAPAPPASQAANCQSRGAARFNSVEVAADGKITFRFCAPGATQVQVASADMADVIPFGGGLPMTRDTAGLWSVTTPKAVAPDNYRYNFSVNGIATADPRPSPSRASARVCSPRWK